MRIKKKLENVRRVKLRTLLFPGVLLRMKHAGAETGGFWDGKRLE